MSGLNQKIQGLLGNPAFNLGVGLLANSGPQIGPKRSFGQVLAPAMQFANQQQAQFQQLQAQRAAMQQQKNQQNALKQIGGLLNNTAPASIAAPPQLAQQRIMGLLAQANPQAFTQGLLQQQFAQPRTPAIPREAALAKEMFPNEPLETSLPKVMQIMGQTDPKEALEFEKLRLEIDNLIQSRQSEQESEQQESRLSQQDINTSIGTIGGIAESLQTLSGSFLQPGVPLPAFRRGVSGALKFGQDLLGIPSGDRAKVNTAADLVSKDLNGLILSTIQNFGDGLTVSQTEILRRASASPEITPQAIAKVLEVALDARVFAASNDPDISLENQEQIDEIRSLLKELQSFEPVPPLPQGFVEDN